MTFERAHKRRKREARERAMTEESAGAGDVTKLVERLRREAEFHAMEARMANASLRECYQVVTEGKGEPGTWNGAGPVREAFAALRQENERLRNETEQLLRDYTDTQHTLQKAISKNVLLIHERAALRQRETELVAALATFVAHYPMGLNPFLDQAFRDARALVSAPKEPRHDD